MRYYDVQKKLRIGQSFVSDEPWKGGGTDVYYLLRTETGMEFWHDTHYPCKNNNVFNNPSFYRRGHIKIDINTIYDEVPEHVMLHFKDKILSPKKGDIYDNNKNKYVEIEEL